MDPFQFLFTQLKHIQFVWKSISQRIAVVKVFKLALHKKQLHPCPVTLLTMHRLFQKCRHTRTSLKLEQWSHNVEYKSADFSSVIDWHLAQNIIKSGYLAGGAGLHFFNKVFACSDTVLTNYTILARNFLSSTSKYTGEQQTDYEGYKQWRECLVSLLLVLQIQKSLWQNYFSFKVASTQYESNSWRLPARMPGETSKHERLKVRK